LIPEENGGKLAISKLVGQWGIPIDEKQDLARVDVKKDKADPRVDQLTISVGANQGGGGIIRITWENAQYSVPFTVEKSAESTEKKTTEKKTTAEKSTEKKTK
jgi:hypothetical protein